MTIEDLERWLLKQIQVCDNKIDRGEPFYYLEARKEAYEKVIDKLMK